jgi:hypothetical protein
MMCRKQKGKEREQKLDKGQLKEQKKIKRTGSGKMNMVRIRSKLSCMLKGKADTRT